MFTSVRAVARRLRPSAATLARWTGGWRGAVASLVVAAVLRGIRGVFVNGPVLLHWISDSWADWAMTHQLSFFLVMWVGVWLAVFVLFNELSPASTKRNA